MKEKILEDENKVEKKEPEFMDDFEVVDDVFFMDDFKKEQKNEKSKISKENKYLKKDPHGLSTIPEEKHNKIKNNNDSNDIKNDFTIIETKSSLQRKMIREKKEENGDKYSFELESLSP